MNLGMSTLTALLQRRSPFNYYTFWHVRTTQQRGESGCFIANLFFSKAQRGER